MMRFLRRLRCLWTIGRIASRWLRDGHEILIGYRTREMSPRVEMEVYVDDDGNYIFPDDFPLEPTRCYTLTFADNISVRDAMPLIIEDYGVQGISPISEICWLRGDE